MSTSHQNKRWNVFRVLFAICIGILIFEACRKMDYKRDKPVIITNGKEKFFTIPANTDPRVVAIADRIKRQNDTANFVEQLVKKIGFPVWNKAMIASPKNTNRTNEDSSGIEYLYIPFDHDSTIDATLIVRTDSEDTLMRLLNDWEYSLAGFDTTNTEHWHARNIFHLFSYFE